MDQNYTIKIVGRCQPQRAFSPAEYHRRASALQLRVDRLNPYPKPRGFVFKAKSWDDYETWKSRQTNPRLWQHHVNCYAEIDGVRIPYAGLKSLIASKETYREQDRADLLRLRALARIAETHPPS